MVPAPARQGPGLAKSRGLAASTVPKPRSSRRGLPLGFYVLISCRAGSQARPRAAFHIPSLLVASQGSTSRWLQQPCPRVPNSWGQPLDPFFPSPLAQKKKVSLEAVHHTVTGNLGLFYAVPSPDQELRAQDFTKIFLPVPIYFIRT